MIKLLKGLPDNVLGFEAIGKVTGDDYETVLIPAVEAKLKVMSKVRLLYYIGTDFSSYDMGAMWDDTKIGLEHMKAWERIALVSDIEWIRKAVHLFGFTMPGRVRVYKNNELSDAKRWLSE
jgi:hypothetical protein